MRVCLRSNPSAGMPHFLTTAKLIEAGCNWLFHSLNWDVGCSEGAGFDGPTMKVMFQSPNRDAAQSDPAMLWRPISTARFDPSIGMPGGLTLPFCEARTCC